MQIGDWIKSRGLTDVDFAELVGVDKSTVGRWVAGTVRPDWDRLPKIIEVTEGLVTANDFIPKQTQLKSAAAHRVNAET